jgi:ABC-type lipoprotein release transport system permease subunit
MIWIIAWKNIWRNKTRSLVLILAIALGLTAGVFSSAVMQGTGDQRIREAVNRETAHLQVHNPKYLEDYKIEFILPPTKTKLEEALDTMKEVQAWSSRIRIQAMASSANAGTGVIIYGIDPGKETKVTEIHSLICDSCGDYFGPARGNPIVIGRKLAEKLKIRLHSKIVLTFQDIQGNLTGAAFRVMGMYHTCNSVFDEMTVFVRKDALALLVGLDPKEDHEIAILLHDTKKVPEVQQHLKRMFTGMLIQSWQEIDPLVGILDGLMDLWLYLFMGIILAALGFGIINTMLMAILERTRELGMLTAIGMNKSRVFRMIILESVYISLIGGIIGMILGYLLTLWTGYIGINLGSFAKGFEKIGYSPIMYPALDIMFFIILTCMVIITGILASCYPAIKALKLKPAEAVRIE